MEARRRQRWPFIPQAASWQHGVKARGQYLGFEFLCDCRVTLRCSDRQPVRSEGSKPCPAAVRQAMSRACSTSRSWQIQKRCHYLSQICVRCSALPCEVTKGQEIQVRAPWTMVCWALPWWGSALLDGEYEESAIVSGESHVPLGEKDRSSCFEGP